MNPELLEKLAELSAQNGQLVLLQEVLQWATDNRSHIAEAAMRELIELAHRYGV